MPRKHSTAAECRSLANKIGAYVSEAPARTSLHGLAEYATDLAHQEDRSTLLRLSREVDTWLREVHAPSEALLLIARMRRRGVLENHLPILASAKRLKAIAQRGHIGTKVEAELVQSVFANPELLLLLHAQRSTLGAALDAWHSNRRHARTEA